MNHRAVTSAFLAAVATSAAVASGCRPTDDSGTNRVSRGGTPDTVVLFVAASLTKAVQPALDTFTARTGIVVLRESGASLEHARKLTELNRIPDVLMLADEEVFPEFLAPKFVTSWVSFARNRMVVAYTERSKYATEVSPGNWAEVLARKDVQVGRTDPDLAPAGYRTILMLRLAEKHYARPGLADRLIANAPTRNIRPNAAELAALLAAGELDYIYEYRSLAVSNGFKYLDLPPEIDLGDPTRDSIYATVSVETRGKEPGKKATFAGKPILYAAAIPTDAPHAKAAHLLWSFLFAADGQRFLRDAKIDLLDTVVTHMMQPDTSKK